MARSRWLQEAFRRQKWQDHARSPVGMLGVSRRWCLVLGGDQVGGAVSSVSRCGARRVLALAFLGTKRKIHTDTRRYLSRSSTGRPERGKSAETEEPPAGGRDPARW